MQKFNQEDIFLITGASSGIGKQVALDFNKFGATVIATGRSIEKLESVKAESVSPERFHIVAKDLTEDVSSIPLWITELKKQFGKMRGLVCCAGITDIKPLQALTEESLLNVFETNYFAPVFCAKGFLDRRNNVGEGATVVFIASIAAELCDAGHVAYSGSKASLIASSKSMSKECSSRKIRVNCISPGDIDTPMLNFMKDTFAHDDDSKYPLGLGSVEDISNLVLFLSSNDSKWITGQNYVLDGGLHF